MIINALDFTGTITEAVKNECQMRNIPVEGTRLLGVLNSLDTRNQPLLVVVDEAQALYPDKEQSTEFERSKALVAELQVLAQQPGCVCWLTGSSQALHHLAFAGRHPAYYGTYHDLNDKKYAVLHHLALRDPQSIQEFLQAETSTIVPTDKITELYELYGGAMGDLVQQKPLPRSYIAAWDKTAQAVLLALVLAQPTTSASKPWNLVPIPGHTAREVIERTNPGCPAEIELQRMCDMYLLERDNLDQYHIAYPEAIHHCDPSGDHALIERASHAAVPPPPSSLLSLFALYTSFPLLVGIYINYRNALPRMISWVLRVVLQAMHNIPYDATKNNRRFEDHAHATVHVMLWLCCSRGVTFDSGTKNQIGILDIVIITKQYRHYLELKAEKGDSATEALQQITDKYYDSTFPRTSDQQRLPAFRYGIKWKDKSTHATVEVAAEGGAADTSLWKNKLSLHEHRHIISV